MRRIAALLLLALVACSRVEKNTGPSSTATATAADAAQASVPPDQKTGLSGGTTSNTPTGIESSTVGTSGTTVTTGTTATTGTR